MTENTIKAIIPVRSGSSRVIDKNIRPFCSSSLLEIRVRQMLEVRGLNGVCVSSNDKDMLETARLLGAETHLRDSYFATDTIPMGEVYNNMVSQMECDDVLYTTVTTPLVKTASYESAIKQYKELSSDYDSISSVADVKDFLLRDSIPLNYDPKRFPRSQDLPNITRLTFAISILPRQLMMEKKSSVGYNPKFLTLSQMESIDVDTPVDFEICEFLYRKYVIKQGR